MAKITLKRAVSYHDGSILIDFKAGQQIDEKDVDAGTLAQWKRDGFIEGAASKAASTIAQGPISTPIGQPIELKSETDPILGQESTGTIVAETAVDAPADAVKVEAPTVAAEVKVDDVAKAATKPGKVTRAKAGE